MRLSRSQSVANASTRDLFRWGVKIYDVGEDCEVSGRAYRYCTPVLFRPEHEMPGDKARTPRECTLVFDMLDCSLPENGLLRSLELFECVEASFKQARDNLGALVEEE